MESPCITCELNKQSKSKCTDIKNYCRKLIEFQNKLDKQDHSIKSTTFDQDLPITFGKKKGIYSYGFD